MPPAIRASGVSKAFGPVRAVDGLDLEVAPGQVLVLLGPSGCGKTTTLRLIAGFEAPDAGSVEVGGRPVCGPGVWVPPEQRRVGMVFQDYALFPHLTVAQNVAFGLQRRERRQREARVREVLELVRLAPLAGRYPHELSGGEQQRVALARALAPRPVVVLLDEPFSNLDPELRARVRGEVRAILKDSGATAVFVTHDRQEALAMGDRVAVLLQGRVLQEDTPERLFQWPRSRFVAEFLGTADFLPAWVGEEGVVTELGVLPQRAPLPPGTPVEVMARPDDFVLHAIPGGEGRIVGRAFLGMHYVYEVALPSGCTVRVLASHTQAYPEGTPVRVALAPGHALNLFHRGALLPGDSHEESPWPRSGTGALGAHRHGLHP